MPDDDARPADADRPCRLDELLLAQRHHLGPHDARVALPAGEAEHHDDREEARPERGHERERQQDLRERERDVHDGADDGIHRAAQESARQPGRHADDEAHQDGRHPDEQRDAGPVDDPAQHVAPDLIGAERIGGIAAGLPHRRREPAEQRLLGRIVRRDPRRGDRDAHHRQQDKRADERGRVEREPPPGARAAGAR